MSANQSATSVTLEPQANLTQISGIMVECRATPESQALGLMLQRASLSPHGNTPKDKLVDLLGASKNQDGELGMHHQTCEHMPQAEPFPAPRAPS